MTGTGGWCGGNCGFKVRRAQGRGLKSRLVEPREDGNNDQEYQVKGQGTPEQNVPAAGLFLYALRLLDLRNVDKFQNLSAALAEGGEGVLLLAAGEGPFGDENVLFYGLIFNAQENRVSAVS